MIMKRKINLLLWLSSMLVMGLGCSSSTQTQQFYTLHSASVVSSEEPLIMNGHLGVGLVELPEFLVGNNIVTLVGDQQIQKSQTHLWGGDLQLTLSRTVAANLSQQLGADNVWPFPWDTRHRPEKQINILVEQLDGTLGGEVTLAAKWTLLDDEGARLVHVGRQRFTATAVNDTYADYVAAVNNTVNQLSQILAKDVRKHWASADHAK
jgi:uncharacterized protein